MMHTTDPVYVDLTAENIMEPEIDDFNERNMVRVKRRPFVKSLRNRLTDIVSMYIPTNTLGDRKMDGLDEMTDHTELLSETNLEFTTYKNSNLYNIKLLHKREQLMKAVSNCIMSMNNVDLPQPNHIVTLAAHRDTIYVGFNNLPFAFTFSTNPESPNCNYIELYLRQYGHIYPKELCVHTRQTGLSVLYVVGVVYSTTTTDLQTDKTSQPKWILAQFSLDGKQLARSRLYDYQRYSGICVDTLDDQLLLACPTIREESHGDAMVTGQVCKLTSGFERRVFSITMGKDSVIYKPEYVTQESAGQYCWTSVEKWINTDDHGVTLDQPKLIGRRLLAFPSRSHSGLTNENVREWLHACSLDFADLSAGQVVAFDQDRVLVIDSLTGTLAYIIWPDFQDTPSIIRVTRPTSSSIDYICSTYSAKMDQRPMAYFTSESNLYSFSFV